MARKPLAIYRLPIPTATRIGQVRVVVDRNGRCYVEGSPVVETIPSGIHTTLRLADGRDFHVLTKDLERL